MFKIGDFSRLSKVSVKALRHYDELGLLKPEQVDPFTGYRYYSAAQLPTLNRILVLKDLGFSLEQIGPLLRGELSPQQIRGMLTLKRAEIEQQVRGEQERLARIEARLRQIEEENKMPKYDVVLKKVEPQLAASLREVISKPENIEQLFFAVETFVAKNGNKINGAPMAIWHDQDYRETNMDAEAALPLSGAISGDERISMRELPGIDTAACVVYEGPYSGISEAYAALTPWLQNTGYRIAGPCREVYLRFGEIGTGLQWPEAYLTKSDADFVTEIQFPVEKA